MSNKKEVLKGAGKATGTAQYNKFSMIPNFMSTPINQPKRNIFTPNYQLPN